MHLRKEKATHPSVRMYQISGTNNWNIHAIEISPKIQSLNSAGCFVIYNETEIFLWKGKNCTEQEEKFGQTTIAQLCPDKTVRSMNEGSETPAFWELIKSVDKDLKIDYPYKLSTTRAVPRMWECSVGTGENFHFSLSFYLFIFFDFCDFFLFFRLFFLRVFLSVFYCLMAILPPYFSSQNLDSYLHVTFS